MTKKINWIGRRYGKLIVTKELPNNKFLCRCECGNEVEVFKTNLSTGQKVNCGCEPKLKLNYINKRFGNLTALKYDAKKRKWLCKCDCGNNVYITTRNLTYNNTTSCGCKRVTTLLNNMYDCDTNIHQFNLYDTGKSLKINNTSGYTGVTYNKRRNKWAASIMFRKKLYFLGYHDKKEDAVKARKLAEEKLHGEFLDWYENEYKKGMIK